MEVLRQAKDIRNATSNYFAFRNKLALSGIAEYAVRVTLASGPLRQSSGCVVLPTASDLAWFATVTIGTLQQGVATRARVQETAERGR